MTIQLKDIDPGFAQRAKSVAYGRGMTLKEFIVQAIQRALEAAAGDDDGK